MLSRVWNALLRAAPLRLWAMIAAGPFLSIGAISLVLIIWRGGWAERFQGRQLDFLGYALLIVLLLIGVIIVTLASVRVSGRGPGGLGFEIDADGPAPSATVTTTTTVKPGAPE